MIKNSFKIIIVSIIIMTLTLANFISVGVGMTTYAAEVIDADKSTNNKNIQFLAYFTNEKGEKLKSTEQSIQKEDLKLYMEIEVKKEGYFNGQITIDDSNFKLKSEILSESIHQIEGNKITLNQINAGQKVEIEVGITPIKDDKFDLSLLNMKSKISLNGIYKNSSEKDIKIKATREVELSLINPFNENEGIELNYQIITNKTSVYNNANKRIVQLLVKSGVNNNAYPIKETKIEVEVPELSGNLPEQVLVSSKGTLATNGNKKYILSKDEWNYNQKNKKVTIQIENKAEDNKITWNKTGKDEFIVTFIYSDIDETLNKENIKVNSQITLYDAQSTILKTNADTQSQENIENLENIVSVSSKESEEKIYKGKIYSKIEREITQTTQVDINLNNVAEEMIIQENTKTMIQNQDQEIENENIMYKETTINKEQLINILGENFVLEIVNPQNRLQLAEITKDTEVNENGDIVITYQAGEVKAIEIKTTKPENIGKIEITNKKIIMQTENEIAKLAKEIKTTVSGKIKTQSEETPIQTATSTIKLEEPQTTAKLEVSRNNLSTVVENKGVEIKAILETNEESSDLYSNPIIKIELPEEVQELKVNSINKLYGDEFEVERASSQDENGKKVIEIRLKGEQTEYKDIAIAGTTLIINADIKLDRKAASSEKEIKLIYTNEKATKYKNDESQGEEIFKTQIVAPKGLITINNIENLNVETIGENEEQNVMLQKATDSKTVKVETEIINNNNSAIADVKVMGTFPTNESQIDDKKSNIQTSVLSPIAIEGIDAKVYYTENSNATDDLQNASNQWKETIENGSNVKKYLIVANSIENAESVKASYDVGIPANLGYNQQAYTGYSVNYTNVATQKQETTKSTTINAETGVGPQIETNITAKVGQQTLENNAEVKTGEVIKYEVTVKSTGSEDAENVKIEGQIPEGTVYVEPEQYYQYTGASYYKEIEKDKHEIEIGTIKPGESVTKTYEVRVKQDAKNNTAITNKSEVFYGEAKQETNEFRNIVKTGNLRVSAKSLLLDEEQFLPGDQLLYGAVIENTSNETQKNVILHTNLSDDVQVKKVYKITGLKKNEVTVEQDDETGELTYEYEENEGVQEEEIKYSEDMNIGDIKSGENIFISYEIDINDSINALNKNIEFSVIAKDSSKQEYRSNVLQDTVNDIKIETSMTSPQDAQTLKTWDKIEYNIIVKNLSEISAGTIEINDKVPSQLNILSVTQDGQDIQLDEGQQNLNISTEIAENSTTEINIKAEVAYSLARTEPEVIANKAEISLNGELMSTTSEISNVIEQSVEKYENVPSEEEQKPGDNQGSENNQNTNNNNGENNGSNNNGNGGNQGTPTVNAKNIISGTAWLDENTDGKKDATERLLSGITVRLLNIETNEIQKDANGNEISAKTSNDGTYILQNVPSGEYVVIFEYDTSKYAITQYQREGLSQSENSNAVLDTLSINGQEKKCGITDVIQISGSSVTGINIGLIELQDFDIQLDKYIEKIIVQNDEGTSTYSFDESKLAKVEIAAKHINGSMVTIMYGIKVTNYGQVDSYVSGIVDYLSSDFQFSSEVNPDWYKSGEYIYNNSLENQKIAAGESKTIKLVVTKTMNEDNTGLINNTAEISEQYNELGFEDKNSTPGNKAQGENDMSNADAIIGVKTGGATYVAIVIVVLAIIGLGVFIINKKVLKKKI